jgi:hypothetical protein
MPPGVALEEKDDNRTLQDIGIKDGMTLYFNCRGPGGGPKCKDVKRYHIKNASYIVPFDRTHTKQDRIRVLKGRAVKLFAGKDQHDKLLGEMDQQLKNKAMSMMDVDRHWYINAINNMDITKLTKFNEKMQEMTGKDKHVANFLYDFETVSLFVPEVENALMVQQKIEKGMMTMMVVWQAIITRACLNEDGVLSLEETRQAVNARLEAAGAAPMSNERIIEIKTIIKQDGKVHDDVIKAMLNAVKATQQEVQYVLQHMHDMDEDL